MNSIFIVAVESSGDQLGAKLIKVLRNQDSSLSISGVGGPSMAAQDVSSDIDISGLAILGFVEALKAYPLVLRKVKEVTERILEKQPSCVVLIDSWGFMIRVAQALKKAGFTGRIVKYVAPQVWAMREGRAKILAQSVDYLLSLHSFDGPYFEKYGLETSYVGNPVFETDFTQGDPLALRKNYNIPHTTKIVAVLFGSRLSEIKTLATPFAEAVSRIRATYTDVCFISPVSETIATAVKAAAGADMRLQDIILLPENRKWDVFAAAHTALSCSGTVTTQLACMGVPSVVAYKLNPLTYFFAKRLYKPDFISIVNIAAGKALMPEYVQASCTGGNLAASVLEYLNNDAKHEKARNDLRAQTHIMTGQGGAGSTRAAKIILSL